MRHYPAIFTRDQVEGWIDWNLANYERHGYGLWALVLKETGEVIGDCGLTWQRVGYSPDRELEAGWHVRRDLWNRGLATEAGIKVRDYARERLGRRRLISKIEPGNLASIAVARKLGMTLERHDLLDGKELLIYAMTLAPPR
jgi:RimJ/RimL family protein N-acetyltransferase